MSKAHEGIKPDERPVDENATQSNQWVSTPQQRAFLEFYLDPQSETWSNAKQSAIRAGYTEKYADSILAQMPEWLSGALRQSNMVQQALTNLAEALRDDENKSIKWDATKFSLSRLSAPFKEKKDITTDGKPLQVNFDSTFNATT